MAVGVLKNLLIKHAMDDRYTVFKVRDGEAPKEEVNTAKVYKLNNRTSSILAVDYMSLSFDF